MRYDDEARVREIVADHVRRAHTSWLSNDAFLFVLLFLLLITMREVDLLQQRIQALEPASVVDAESPAKVHASEAWDDEHPPRGAAGEHPDPKEATK